jgi:nucleotide-binding universal stress UspA family protein
MNFLLSIDAYSYIMTTEDKTVSKSAQKDKEDPSTTLSAETGEDNITKPSGEKKVAVVTPTKGQYNESQVQRQEMERNKEESISDKAKEAAQSFKSLVKPANSKKVIPSVKSRIQTDVDINLEYNRILVPHDGSEMSDKALNHAIYLSKKLSSEEIVILNVLQHVQSNTSSALVVTSEGEGVEKAKKEELEVSLEGSLKQKIEEKMRLCKEAGVKSQVSFKVQTGQPVDEIVKLSEDMNVDLIVMASSRITSSIKGLGSTTRKVIDKAKRPVLVIHE